MDPNTDGDWDNARYWSFRHPVRGAFAELAREVRRLILRGACKPADAMDEAESALRATTRDRLVSATRIRTRKVGGRALIQLELPCKQGRWVGVTGAPPRTGRKQLASDGRDCAWAQLLAMSPWAWRDPAVGLLLSAAQGAVHRVIRERQGRPEPELTIALMDQIVGLLRDRFLPPLNGPGPALPPGSFLDVATMSMTDRRDRMGADFAVVVGTMDRDGPRFRVALFQAKWEDAQARGTATVARGGDRAQLEELLATRAGHYVFYPRMGKDMTSAPMTIRSAADVDEELSHRARGASVGICSDANGCWEFASFLALAMMDDPPPSSALVLGTLQEVVGFLLTGSSRPLAPTTLVVDRTRQLRVRGLGALAREAGYDAFSEMLSFETSVEVESDAAGRSTPTEKFRPGSPPAAR